MEFGFAPIQSDPRFDRMREQARLAESLGFATLWAHEHHSQGMMYPDPLMTLAALAPVTQRIGLGTNMLLLPIHHPVRVAQEAAMVDVLSGGRLRLGIANGYSARDFSAFGVSTRQRGARLERGLELLRALFTGEPVTRSCDEYDLDDFTLFPPQIQLPHPPIYVGGQADVAVRRAARLGDNYLISTTETRARVRQLVSRYHELCSEVGRPDRPAPLLNRIVCVVESAAARRRAAEFFAQALLALYDAWGHANITTLGETQRDVDTVCAEHFVLGEPNECVECIHAYAEAGIGHIACLMNFGGADVEWVENSMRLMGEKVFPEFG